MRGTYQGDVRVSSKSELESGAVRVLFGCASGMFSGIFTKENAEKFLPDNFYKVDVEMESRPGKDVGPDGKKRWFANLKSFNWERFEKSSSQNQAL